MAIKRRVVVKIIKAYVILQWFSIFSELSCGAQKTMIDIKDKKLKYRLSTDVEPIDYVIELTPYFDSNITGKEPFTFDGICNISLKAGKSGIDTITLHKQDLQVIELNLTKNDDEITIESTDYDNISSKYTLQLATPLVENEEYVLSIKYMGKLQSDLYGFYRSSYKEANITKWLAMTQMEPSYARKVFPCFDEPGFKATFSIIINRPAHFKPSISNAPLMSSQLLSKKNLVRDEFQKTPRMSTYIIAFVVSEFECRENESKDFYVCAQPNAYDQTEYSFRYGQKSLSALENLFDYKYNTHMPKMTLAALPDFDPNYIAMENWGLLAFQEAYLLFDPTQSSTRNKQIISMLITHELTHMWFGNLVTCDWWAHMWLNEGFASYFTYFGTALVEESWGLEQQFVANQIFSVLFDDSMESTAALSQDVNTPDEVRTKTSGISYKKGASIIRMMYHIFGSEQFVAALRNYIKTNALQTGVPEKLYAAFQGVIGSEYNVTELMDAWVYKPGYPLITAAVANDRKRVVITQKRYLQNNPNQEDKTLWHVPITYATDKVNNDFADTKPTKILSNESFEIEFKEPIDWIILNVQQTGYYRVNYDNDTWSVIANVLQKSHSSIHVLNRGQIINNVLTFARGGVLSYQIAFDVIKYLKNETEFVPWAAAFDGFKFILNRFKPSEASIFEEFELKLFNKLYEYLGFKPKDSDGHLDIFNRNNVLKHACQFGHEQCISDAQNEFNKLVQGNHTIPVDLVDVVYCTAVAEGSDEEWNFLWNKFKSTNLASEKVTILNALGYTKQANLIEEYFKVILSDDIRLQDKHNAFESTLTHRQNIPVVLEQIQAKHKDINAVFQSDKEVPKLLSKILSMSSTREEIEKVQKFAEENKFNVETALKDANSNLQWAEKYVPIIKEIIMEMD